MEGFYVVFIFFVLFVEVFICVRFRWYLDFLIFVGSIVFGRVVGRVCWFYRGLGIILCVFFGLILIFLFWLVGFGYRSGCRGLESVFGWYGKGLWYVWIFSLFLFYFVCYIGFYVFCSIFTWVLEVVFMWWCWDFFFRIRIL